MKPTTAAAPTTACRAVTFPFTPHGGMKWPELAPLLRQCWEMSTRLANWAVSQLYLADGLTAEREGGRLSPMPHLYLYGLFSRSYPERAEWAGAAAAANCVLRAVTKKYAERRLDVLGRGACSLASYRFPYPFPVHNQNWKAYYGKDNVPLVDVSLPGGRVTLRLRGGPEMARQLAGFRRIVEGAKRGELALYRKGRREMVKLVAHLPVAARKPGEKTMLVRTDPAAFWVAEVGGTCARVWNQDHLRALVERHRVWLQRVSEDTKHERRERRLTPGQLRHINRAREERCRKQNDRLNSACHELSAEASQFAARRGAGALVYDDACKDYLPRFPWHHLREKLRYKCEALGINFVCNPGPEDDSENSNGEGE